MERDGDIWEAENRARTKWEQEIKWTYNEGKETDAEF